MGTLNILFEITVYSAVIYTATILLKICFKSKMSPLLHYAIWFVLVLRLLMPVTIASPVRLFVISAETQNAAVQQVQPQAYEPISAPGISETEPAEAQLQTAVEAYVPGETQTAPVTFHRLNLPLPQIVTFVWLAGTVICLWYLAVLYASLRRKFKKNAARPSKALTALFEEVKAELGIKTDIKLVCQYEYGTPALMFPKTIMMPADALVAMNEEQTKFALRHELTHYKRRDHVTSILLSLLNAVYWFNPFVWLAFRQMRADMETACDGTVVKLLSASARSRYASLILSLSAQPAHRQLVLGMSHSNVRKAAERRVKGIFMREESKMSVKLITVLLALTLIFTCFTTACQPTPEIPLVIGKGDGAMESAINRNNSVPSSLPYDAPGHLALKVDGLPDDYVMNFDAEVNVSDQTEWPVYSVEPTNITQQEVDGVRLALLDGAVLYKPGKYRSREEIQRNIDSYQNELQLCIDDTEYPEDVKQKTIDAYQEILKNLYIEYENSPEDLKLEEADTKLQFMENRVDARIYGGKEIKTEDGGFRYEWTNEARQRAIEAGCGNIFGVCWTESGRKMSLSVDNNDRSSGLYYSVDDGNAIDDPGVTYSLDEAVSKANELLKNAGLDFTLVQAYTEIDRFERVNEDKGPWYHSLVYKRRIDGVPQDNIVSLIEQSGGEDNSDTIQNGGERFRSPIPDQETIRIYLDDYGVKMLVWNQPWKVTALENPNVALQPFDKISARITEQLKMQTLWDAKANDIEAKWIDSRRLEVNKVALSYLVVAKKDNMASYYLIPVWNICGDMYYHYTDSYPTGQSNTYVLDENNERLAWRSRYQIGEYSMLTINAIDGTVIQRNQDG